MASELAQAVWDAYLILGFDGDGNTTPMGDEHSLALLIVDAAREVRADYDEACEAAWATALAQPELPAASGPRAPALSG